MDNDKFGSNGNFGLVCDLGSLGAIFPDPAQAPPLVSEFKHTYLCLKCSTRWAANELIPCPICGHSEDSKKHG